MATGRKPKKAKGLRLASVAPTPVKGAYPTVEFSAAASRFNVQSGGMGRAVAEQSLKPKRYDPALSATDIPVLESRVMLKDGARCEAIVKLGRRANTGQDHRNLDAVVLKRRLGV
jgi:hypothetical protein